MEFMRLGPRGHERPVVRQGDTVHDMSSLTNDIDGIFFDDGGIGRTRTALADGSLPVISGWENERVGAPVARPGAVICVGQNYAAHVAECGLSTPEHPVVFLKHPNTVVGPYDDVAIPRGCTHTDWEVELTVVIGRRAQYVDSPEEAQQYIAGYTISNDVSERDLQNNRSGGQWTKGKTAATFCPVGPVLVPADEIDPQVLDIRSFVNGEPRQDSNTKDMIFKAAWLVSDLSQYMILEPGDIVLTGTPGGVALGGRFPYLEEGDVVELEIEKLGRQRQQLVAWDKA
jgi:2-keto-4-pentenoate hydratase/2-oxohepta-3-ene-1,7-dioic acid hydratase in catechol pathway